MEFHSLAEQAGAFLGLPVDPAYRDGVAANLALLHGHAARVMALDLPPDIDAAPVFVP